ncbi:mCG144560, partial [Mus musculus]
EVLPRAKARSRFDRFPPCTRSCTVGNRVVQIWGRKIRWTWGKLKFLAAAGAAGAAGHPGRVSQQSAAQLELQPGYQSCWARKQEGAVSFLFLRKLALKFCGGCLPLWIHFSSYKVE